MTTMRYRATGIGMEGVELILGIDHLDSASVVPIADPVAAGLEAAPDTAATADHRELPVPADSVARPRPR